MKLNTFSRVAAIYVVFACLALAEPPEDKVQGCGPPEYCARTDRDVAPYGATPPALGPAGSIIRDPSFGSRILRVTDTKSDLSGLGRSFMTPAAGEQNSWNSDTTEFYILTPGGAYILYHFSPSEMTVRQLGTMDVAWGGDPEFSYQRPDVLFGTRLQNPAIQEYEISSRRVSDVNRPSSCLELGPRDYGHGVTVSADEQRLSTVLGPEQDENEIVYVYDRARGCRWYNTRTGEIGGQWGPRGTISIPNRYGVHNAKMSKSGEFIWITRGEGIAGREIFFSWDVATLDVIPCTLHCSGHFAMGYSHVIGPSGENHPLELLRRPLDNLNDFSPVIAGLQPLHGAQFWYSHHLSWNHVNPDDTTPLCLSTFSLANPTEPGVPLKADVPWENEVLCVETDRKDSKVWRFAHTYSTAREGFWSTPRGNVSQDGRFFMFTSNWQDQLGERPLQKGAHRMDVFIVELR